MIESPGRDNISDFKQRYQGVIGWFVRDNGTKVPVIVSYVSSSKVTFKDAKDGEYFANLDAGVKFEFLPCQRAWINTDEGPLLLQRIPARQFKRGVCSDNTSIHQLLSSGPYPTGGAWSSTAFKALAETVDYATAVDAFLQAKCPSVALSKHFAVGPDDSVWFYSIKIGTFNRKENKVSLSSSLVLQEFSDMVRRNNYTFKVSA